MNFEGLLVALLVVLAHWMGDFLLQTHWQASNKSKNWNALLRHVSIYSMTLTAVMAPYLIWRGSTFGLAIFFGVTFVAHLLTDAVTSRWTAKLWARQDWHNFFVVIGFDQVLHYVQLFLTIWWLAG